MAGFSTNIPDLAYFLKKSFKQTFRRLYTQEVNFRHFTFLINAFKWWHLKKIHNTLSKYPFAWGLYFLAL